MGRVDIVNALMVQAESLAEHHEELLALSVNVMNLQELVRVQNDALRLAVAFIGAWSVHYQHEHGLQEVHPEHSASVDKVVAALAKYNEMMGEGNEH